MATTVVATGQAAAVDPTAFARNNPSLFADPVGWLVVAAVRDALADAPADILSTSDNVGMVVLSNTATAHTMREIARSAVSGRVSPLRFAGSNPGVLAGLACITWKFRGPTLTLTMEPAAGLPTAVIVADAWLRTGQARYVIVAVHGEEDGEQVVRCSVVRGAVAGGGDLSHLLPAPTAMTGS